MHTDLLLQSTHLLPAIVANPCILINFTVPNTRILIPIIVDFLLLQVAPFIHPFPLLPSDLFLEIASTAILLYCGV